VTQTVCLVPGDGVGPEVVLAAQRIMEAAGAQIDWVELPAGASAVENYGSPLPERTAAAIAGHRVALKGPLLGACGDRWPRVNAALRRRLHLHASVWRIRSLPGTPAPHPNVDLVVIAESGEGLDSSIENELLPGVVQNLAVTTLSGCARIARFAFDYATKHNRRKVTVLHRVETLARSDELLLRCARKIHEQFFPSMAYEQMHVDTACMELVRRPEQFDVIVTSNLYGQLVGRLCAGLVGGAQMAAAMHVGDECAVFEPAHGAATDIAGKNLANPLGCLLSGAMLLRHIGQTAPAERVEKACMDVLHRADSRTLTRDLGGAGSTQDFTAGVLKVMSGL